jgi:hypothetical protein
MSHSKYDEYARLNEQIKELTARKDSLKAEIIEEMKAQGVPSVQGSACSLRISPRSKMTLNDEALAGYLREHDIAERHYMAVKVCHKKLQSLISNGLVNSDEVLRFVKIEPYDVLLVGGKEEP